MRQAFAVTGHGIVEPPLESNQPCLHTRAALQIALRRHNRSSLRTVLSSSGDTVRRLRASVSLSGSADGTVIAQLSGHMRPQLRRDSIFWDIQCFNCLTMQTTEMTVTDAEPVGSLPAMQTVNVA